MDIFDQISEHMGHATDAQIRLEIQKKTILTEISQCTAVLYNDWSLQMGQMGPKMTLGTLKMNGNDFPGVQGVLRGSNSVHDLISYIYWRQSDTVYCSRKGGRQRGKGWSKSFFLENKVVVNFNFRHGAKKSINRATRIECQKCAYDQDGALQENIVQQNFKKPRSGSKMLWIIRDVNIQQINTAK